MSNPLIEIENAWQMIEDHQGEGATELVALDLAVGRVLAESVVSDINSPPFDKSLVDGFAIAEWTGTEQVYSIVETVTAGNVPLHEIEGSQATRIMTGCPLPTGAIGVVMVEESEEISKDSIRFNSKQFRPGQNVLPEAQVIGKGEGLLSTGAILEAHHVGALAEFGLTKLKVFQQPRVAVLTTGDELVDPGDVPGPGQIRNSNGAMLVALAKSAGAQVIDLGIGRDNRDSLNEKIANGLESDILVIAGGVSAGILDLIPQCLADNGVEKIFHKVNLKPGKPLWFGKHQSGCLVFGLPGNPVSSLVCFKLFAGAAIKRLGNPPADNVEFKTGKLGNRLELKGGRRTFWPVRISDEDGTQRIDPLAWKGSADQVTFLQANGLVDLQDHQGWLETGTPVRFIEF